MPQLGSDPTAASLIAWQSAGYGSALDLLRAFSSSSPQSRKPRRVVFVTGEATAIDDGEAVAGVAQAPLWGFGRTLLHEHAELRPVIVDCSAAADEREAEALVAEALADERGDREDEVALRGERRYVRRLVRADLHEDLHARRGGEAADEPARGGVFV